MIALLDMDIIAYRAAASAEQEPEEIAVLRADKMVRDILYLVECDQYIGYLTGSNNFRKLIYPEYKANRKDKPKPVHLQAVREYLVANWNSHVTYGCEADDMLAIAHTGENTVLCSIDKDLLQVPGKHFNFVKTEWIDVSELGGLRRFYEQLLIGDKVDNLFGLDGIGKVKAQRYLEGCQTEEEMLTTVYNLYEDKDKLYINLMCMWLMRRVDETYFKRTWLIEEIFQDKDLTNWLQSKIQTENNTRTSSGNLDVIVEVL